MEAGAWRARGWCLQPTYGGLMKQKTRGRPAAPSDGRGSCRWVVHDLRTPGVHVVTADARAVAQHAPPFRAQLPTVTWPDSASGEANPASPCAGPTPAPRPLLRQLRRSTETTGTPEAASARAAPARVPRVPSGGCASGPSWALFSCLWRGRISLQRHLVLDPTRCRMLSSTPRSCAT